jgi:hypothetical protein
MAGVKLPDYTALGPAPTPEAPDSVARYDPSAPYQAMAGLGDQAQKSVSDITDLYNKSQINDVFANQYAPAVRQAATDFYSLQGKAAMDAFPAFQQKLASLRDQSASQFNGEYQLQFNEMANSKAENELWRAGMHAGEQGRQYIAATQDAVVSNHLTNIQNDPSTYDTELQHGKVAIQSYGEQPSVSQSPDEIQKHLSDFEQRAADAKYTTWMQTDPMAAYADYQKNKDTLPGYSQVKLDAQFKPLIRENAADTFTNNLMTQISQNYAANVSPNSGKPFQFTMDHEGGYVSNDSGKGPTNFGINQEANPDVDVQNLTQDQARSIIQTKYANAVGADKMSPAMAEVAVDSAVNMGVAKTQTLLAQANNDPQKLIDLRRQEYQRLATADPAKYGPSLAGWNARLDDLQNTLPSLTTNTAPTSGYQTPTDYMAAHREDLLNQATTWAQTNFPDDPHMATTMRERVNNMITGNVQAQTAQYKQDNQTVMRAINGEMSNGQPPMTFQQLRAVPGVAPVLDRVAVQDSKFYDGVDRMIGQVQARNVTTNSPNGFDTIMRATEPDDGAHPNAIVTQDHLDKLLGKSDGTGINMKDYNDTKPLIESSQPWKDFVAQGMNNVATANGNLDGQGQQRAVAWYNQASQAYSKNKALGDKALPDADLIQNITDSALPHQPSRMEQISNWAKSLGGGAQNTATPQIPVFSNPTDPEFTKLPTGSQFKTSDGQLRIKQ